MGSGSAVVVLGIRDQAVPYLWEGRKFVTFLESRIRNLRAKMGSAMKNHTSLPPCINAFFAYFW